MQVESALPAVMLSAAADTGVGRSRRHVFQAKFTNVFIRLRGSFLAYGYFTINRLKSVTFGAVESQLVLS